MTPAEALASRRSVRSFLPTPVPRATVGRVLAFVGRAPSGTHVQPWNGHVVAGAAKGALCDAVLAAFDAGDRAAARSAGTSTACSASRAARRRGCTPSAAATSANFRFFGAPVGMIVSTHRDRTIGFWLDLGNFLGGLCTAARGEGLHGCLQAARAPCHRILGDHLPIRPEQTAVSGVALGHKDTTAPESRLRTEREPVSAFATFQDG